MIDRLHGALAELGADLSAKELVDALWLAQYMPFDRDPTMPHPSPRPRVPASEIDPAPLPSMLALAGALGPLHRTLQAVKSARSQEQEAATALAERLPWLSVTRPAQQLAFDLALVVDTGPSMEFWRPTVRRFSAMLANTGIFRDIRSWQLDTDTAHGARPALRSQGGRRQRHPSELIAPGRRQVVLILSDCAGPAWRDDSVSSALTLWARQQPVAIVQMFPQRLWHRCALALDRVRWQSGLLPGTPNSHLRWQGRDRPGSSRGIAVPVLEFDARWLAGWATVLSGTGRGWVNGVAHVLTPPAADEPARVEEALPSPADRLTEFSSFASPQAMNLACYLAAVPLALPVMQFVQRQMLPESAPAHLAEIYVGGLIYAVGGSRAHRGAAEYDFHPGIRELLLTRLSRTEILRIMRVVADQVSSQLPTLTEDHLGPADRPAPFALVGRRVIEQLRATGTVMTPPLGPVMPGPVTQPPTQDPYPERSADRPHLPVDVGRSPADQPPAFRSIAPTPAARTSPVWGSGVPARNPSFTGRAQLLADLREKLERTGSATLSCTLHGMGGVGKTQIAIEYVHRFGADYDLVWWVPAQQRAGIRASLAELWHRVGDAGNGGGDEPWARALEALRTGIPCARWLVVFDNADRPEELGELLPQGPGHLIITSRNPVWARRTDAIDVETLTTDESIQLLRTHMAHSPPLSDEDAARFARAAGGLAIALVQAAEWRASSGMAVSDHLKLFEDLLPDMLSDDLPPSYPVSVLATWEMAIDQLRRDDPPAVELLELCSLFAPEPIHRTLLSADTVTELPSTLSEVLRDQAALTRALWNLNRYALVRRDLKRDVVEVHRLIQAAVRRKKSMSEGRRTQLRHAIHVLLLRACDVDPADPLGWPARSRIQPHLVPSEAIDCELVQVRRLVLDQVSFLRASGDSQSAHELAQLAWIRWSSRLGPDHPDSVAAHRCLSR
jgi:NB-ARC domain